ncbi:tryptophan synthase subunit alpha [Flavobacteriaceae bacterium]|jgi:tryptophan synthase alpha chain|nr:tryptophan synthase subunit alpha [Flavobacteriaceae bacterium]MDC1253303.1 tryptophan synthase subunit alpha [bacterium]MBT4312934.1 tryptophan synthase subunit alpha [Flavobacteriaceae bacterium]MBT5091846.1 tryptophan synthase subunit alpha [Flavobacteriaceae bacterium]MBT5283376.1 tryptophan synthase subunit alpha [Flavobacteriaceae bacterium]|tara:strand:- start:18075 stop:18839 length:765 start_codon:yes stop_codon:yes gene_type:complete
MNRIDQKFQEDKKLLSIYFSAGFPNLEDTLPILKNLEAAGVDMVEIGLPFSDPLADGPTIQESSTQALRNGMTTEKLFTQLNGIREHINIPLVLMGYFNPMMQYGIEKFLQRCSALGIDGLIIPDLPVDVYHEEYKSLFDKYGLYNMFLITPQTSEERIRYIDQVSNGFIYMVSSAAVTGAQNTFGNTQTDYFKRIAKMTLKTPTVVGFGISNAETYEAASKYSRGAIIGSAFIKFLEENGVDQIGKFVKSIRD